MSASEWYVIGTSMLVEADTAEEAISRAQDKSGWHWEAYPAEKRDPGQPVTVRDVISAAKILLSEDHENPEYNRAIVELVGLVADLDFDPSDLGGRAAIEASLREGHLPYRHEVDGALTSEPCPGQGECADCQDVLAQTIGGETFGGAPGPADDVRIHPDFPLTWGEARAAFADHTHHVEVHLGDLGSLATVAVHHVAVGLAWEMRQPWAQEDGVHGIEVVACNESCELT